MRDIELDARRDISIFTSRDAGGGGVALELSNQSHLPKLDITSITIYCSDSTQNTVKSTLLICLSFIYTFIAVCKSVGTATNFEFFDRFETPYQMNFLSLNTRPIALK